MNTPISEIKVEAVTVSIPVNDEDKTTYTMPEQVETKAS